MSASSQPPLGDRLTAAAQTILADAEQEAVDLGHAAATSEHLLLALLEAPLGSAGWAFAECGWGPERCKQALRDTLAAPTTGSAKLGSRTLDFMQALELAFEEADRRGHYYVDPDHLLLGALGEPTCASEWLGQLGIQRSAVYAIVERRLWEGLD